MSGSISLPPIPLYQAITKDQPAYIARFAASDAQTKANVAYFQRRAPSIATPAQLLKDYRSLSVVLSAFGMSSAINEPALVRQLMTQDPNDPKSLVKQLNNPSYTRFTQYMSDWTTSPLSNSGVVQTIVSGYQKAQFEQNQDQSSPGIAAALIFHDSVGPSTTLAQLMADPNLLKVVEGATGQPVQFGLLDYAQQVRILQNAVHLKQFSTQAGVDRFAQQYLAMNAINPPPAPPNRTLTSLFGAGGAGLSVLSLFG